MPHEFEEVTIHVVDKGQPIAIPVGFLPVSDWAERYAPMDLQPLECTFKLTGYHRRWLESLGYARPAPPFTPVGNRRSRRRNAARGR